MQSSICARKLTISSSSHKASELRSYVDADRLATVTIDFWLRLWCMRSPMRECHTNYQRQYIRQSDKPFLQRIRPLCWSPSKREGSSHHPAIRMRNWFHKTSGLPNATMKFQTQSRIREEVTASSGSNSMCHCSTRSRIGHTHGDP